MKRVWLRCVLLVFLAGIVTASDLKYEEPKYLTGSIYASGGKQLLYKFKRVATRTGATLNVVREFNYPSGELAARETVYYKSNDLVSYRLEELQTGAEGTATIRRATNSSGGKIDFEYRKNATSHPKMRTEPLEDDVLINDMVGPFLISHWDALQRGDKIKCRYVVVSRRETVIFTFVKDSETTQRGKEFVIVKMEASGALAARLVNPLLFTIEKDRPHRVVKYIGRTTPKIFEAGQWKDFDALTVFDWDSAR